MPASENKTSANKSDSLNALTNAASWECEKVTEELLKFSS